MTFLMIFLALAVAISIQTLRVALHDGRGPQRPPRSHFDDGRFGAPGRA